MRFFPLWILTFSCLTTALLAQGNGEENTEPGVARAEGIAVASVPEDGAIRAAPPENIQCGRRP